MKYPSRNFESSFSRLFLRISSFNFFRPTKVALVRNSLSSKMESKFYIDLYNSYKKAYSLQHPVEEEALLMKVAKTLYTICDKEDFSIEFDSVYPLFDIEEKKNAVKSLKTHCEQDETYTMFQSPTSTKGSMKKTYMLNADGFIEFAIGVRKPKSKMVKRFFRFGLKFLKKFREAIERGEYTVVKNKRSRDEDIFDDILCTKRVKSAKSTNVLNKALPASARVLNDMANKAVTGYYKYEYASILNKEPSDVNLRDYYKRRHHDIVRVLNNLTVDATENRNMTHEQIKQIHAKHCELVEPLAKVYHKNLLKHKLTREKARSTTGPLVDDEKPALEEIKAH